MIFKSHKIFDRSIGIWGTGVVGASALRFFTKHNAQVSLYDHKPISTEIRQKYPHITYYGPEQLNAFLASCEYILPSAGIDLRPYAAYKDKFLCEVDIFYSHYKKPIIAVTGTIGKTTVTQAITDMLTYYGCRAQMGGNIGIGLLDMLDTQDQFDYAVIELSSFQLEHAQNFTPEIAIWTNLYANHLDRHGTLQEYFLAKLPVLKNQTSQHHALIHETVKHYVQSRAQTRYFDISMGHPVKTLVAEYKTHPEHYIILYELADIMELDKAKLSLVFDNLEVPEHRVKLIGTHNNISFYDDSKSTVFEATLGALTRFADRPVILFFGGVSKGVSREPFFENLPKNIKHILFFGKEAPELQQFCSKTAITSSQHATLEDAISQCVSIMQPGDSVLFSPGGASFDLFTDYKHRGKVFQKLVHDLSV